MPEEVPFVRVGVLSDTHNLLRPRVLEILEGCDRILHAGDVGEPEVLRRLEQIAPVDAVLGNTDAGRIATELPRALTGTLGGLAFGMIHRREDIPQDWPQRLQLVVFGHSHRPEMEWRGECLFLNPGSCGARRFTLPLTLAILTFVDHRLVPEIRSAE